MRRPQTLLEGQVQFGGYRPDGVLLIGVGDHQMVMLNIVEGFKTKPIDERIAERYGPWLDAKPTPSTRIRIQQLLDTPGYVVSPEQVGRDVTVPEGPSRQEFAEMLEAAHLDVPSTLPEVKSFADEPDFLSACLAEVVPQMQQAGMTIDDPSSFCALMHLERTGIMPVGTMETEAMPVEEVAPPPMAPEAAAAGPGETLADVPLTPDMPPRTVEELPPPSQATPTLADQAVIAEPAPVAPEVAAQQELPLIPPVVEPGPEPIAVVAQPSTNTIGKPFKKPVNAATAIGKPQG